VSAKFFFTLLNPAIAFALAATFFVLWRKRPSHGHLGVLAGAFVAYGLAFAINDFLEVLEGPMLRVVVNGLFAAAVVAACLSALIRAKAPLPIGWFLCVCGISSVLFGWFLFASPSVQARIYVVNAGFAVLCASTAWNLVVARPKSRIDWLFVGLAVGGFVLALLRPTATPSGRARLQSRRGNERVGLLGYGPGADAAGRDDADFDLHRGANPAMVQRTAQRG
jgi:hypothetical protein